ncbi:copper transporter [Alkaliphilus hydrothermalis]|uniref:Copper transport outer membrane protein, MctB n=1 Tax=Alkaliphilus hydrothermalis TaxID=1482730 RepID=A0ABS2NM70_9FIRM|nr:copper transporter [Alkaliphilus hydrothermalis]MBM7614020.1 hypothetical protein [Alkaliphilus hydrothermalis]
MINMRYYVITIASIFIALGIGIVIGFNINSDGLYISQQEIIVEALEEKFSELNKEKVYFTQEIDKLVKEKEKNIAFIDHVYQEMTSEKLRGLNIGIIITSEDYYYKDIRSTLEKSGANVPIEIQYANKVFALTDKEINEINNRFHLTVADSKELISAINQEVVNLLTFGEISQLLSYFMGEDFVHLTGNLVELKENPIQNVVLAGGGIAPDQRVETVDLDIIRKCLKNLITVVGVERGDVGYSYLPHYKRMDISAVDHINTPMGQISLILELKKIENIQASEESWELE